MFRRLCSLVFVAAVALSGCTGSAEIEPTDEGKSLSQDEMKKAMDESLSHMPADMRKRMGDIPKMPDMSKAPGGGAAAPAGGEAPKQ